MHCALCVYVCVCVCVCVSSLSGAFSRALRINLLSFEEQAEVIVTRPWSLCAHLSILIPFLRCPNSISSFLEKEVRDFVLKVQRSAQLLQRNI